MANAGNTRKANNNAKSTTSTAKRERTNKQKAANVKSAQAATNAQKWLESRGLKKGVVYAAKYRAAIKAGKSEDAIYAEIKALQNAKASENAAKTKKANNNNAKSVASNATSASKRNVATQRQKNLATKFGTAGIKWIGETQRLFKEKKLAAPGKSNDEIIAEIKAMPQYLKEAPPIPRAKRTAAGPSQPAAAGPSQPATAAAPSEPTTVVANKGVAKGMYICEKCKLVANAPAPSAPAGNGGNETEGENYLS